MSIEERIAAPGDHIFFAGDSGSATYICSTGSLAYKHILSGVAMHVEPRSCVGEAVLWTEWEHLGSLVADTASMVVCIDVWGFHEVMRGFVSLCAILEKYARCYVKVLNALGDERSDCMDISDKMSDFLSARSYLGTGVMDHFTFISHHKRDAGPEAALMQEGLETIINKNISHPAHDFIYPVFIDSENLSDLRHLKEHVRRSRVMILLLTEQVLARPWCLVEIATAYKNGIPILPVEIQKDGAKFQYPDESFHEALIAGHSLSALTKNLLQQEGVELPELSAAIRCTFDTIAKPFSPNKSSRTRKAELQDILSRLVPMSTVKRV